MARVEGSEASPATKDKLTKQALALHDEAWVLYKDGRYRAAVVKLEDALALDPEGKEIVYNLAILHEKLAQSGEAARYYRRYLEMDPDAPTKVRITNILHRLEGAEREELAERERQMAAARSTTVADPASRTLRSATLAAAGVSVVAVVVGTVLGISAISRGSGSPETGGAVSVDDLQREAQAAHDRAVAADVSFAIALAAASTGTVLYVAGHRRDNHPRATTVSFGPGLFRMSF